MTGLLSLLSSLGVLVTWSCAGSYDSTHPGTRSTRSAAARTCANAPA